MHLDIPTLMVMGSFIAACSGAVLFGGWWTNRKVRALASRPSRGLSQGRGA